MKYMRLERQHKLDYENATRVYQLTNAAFNRIEYSRRSHTNSMRDNVISCLRNLFKFCFFFETVAISTKINLRQFFNNNNYYCAFDNNLAIVSYTI